MGPNRSLRLRLLEPSDLGFADALRALAGWNQTRSDWQRVLELQPEGCFLAEWNGSPAGTATTICYGTDLAWIGMLLVHPEYRGRGIGTALLHQCVEWLRRRGMRCLKLDATPQGKPLYASLGFREDWPLSRWEINALEAPTTPSTDNVRPLQSSDWDTVVQLDTNAFGVARRELLEKLAKSSNRVVVSQSTSAQATGFGMLRPGSRADYLGPLTATSSDTATAIIAALAYGVGRRACFWDIPDANAAAISLATRMGFKVQRSLVRMCLGENKQPGDPMLQFAIADPAVG